LTELTRLWLSPLPCQREQDWEVLAALPRLKSLGCVVPRVSPPAGALLRAVTELQVRVAAVRRLQRGAAALGRVRVCAVTA
jgi:hypothetical protein